MTWQVIGHSAVGRASDRPLSLAHAANACSQVLLTPRTDVLASVMRTWNRRLTQFALLSGLLMQNPHRCPPRCNTRDPAVATRAGQQARAIVPQTGLSSAVPVRCAVFLPLCSVSTTTQVVLNCAIHSFARAETSDFDRSSLPAYATVLLRPASD